MFHQKVMALPVGPPGLYDLFKRILDTVVRLKFMSEMTSLFQPKWKKKIRQILKVK